MNVIEPVLKNTIESWPKVAMVLSTLYSEEQYQNAVHWLDVLIDQTNEKDDPSLESLIDTLGTLIKDYEDRTLIEPDGSPVGALKFLMDEHHLKQSDLKELGSQGVVSEILNGKRELNVRQIKALSKRFHVSPAVFV